MRARSRSQTETVKRPVVAALFPSMRLASLEALSGTFTRTPTSKLVRRTPTKNSANISSVYCVTRELSGDTTTNCYHLPRNELTALTHDSAARVKSDRCKLHLVAMTFRACLLTQRNYVSLYFVPTKIIHRYLSHAIFDQILSRFAHLFEKFTPCL